MTRLILMVCAFIVIGMGLVTQAPWVIVGGSAAALYGALPWSGDRNHKSS
jgi:hypothetical protein